MFCSHYFGKVSLFKIIAMNACARVWGAQTRTIVFATSCECTPFEATRRPTINSWAHYWQHTHTRTHTKRRAIMFTESFQSTNPIHPICSVTHATCFRSYPRYKFRGHTRSFARKKLIMFQSTNDPAGVGELFADDCLSLHFTVWTLLNMSIQGRQIIVASHHHHHHHQFPLVQHYWPNAATLLTHWCPGCSRQPNITAGHGSGSKHHLSVTLADWPIGILAQQHRTT